MWTKPTIEGIQPRSEAINVCCMGTGYFNACKPGS